MLFNSYIFILAFFPLVVLGYFAINHFGKNRLAKAFLILMSLIFYGWLNPSYVLIIILSICVNFFLSGYIKKGQGTAAKKILLIAGILFNILLIGYFKYYDFFVSTINYMFRSDFVLLHIALPLGISFYTLQQIGYLVDSYRGETDNYTFLEYALFVVFFPQLVAGPIVQHSEIVPQLRNPVNFHINLYNMERGFVRFSKGLAKKVLLADTFAIGVDWFWGNISVASGGDAIYAMLLYPFQLYFDFSGYSDMAIGISECFNIRLPENFNFPYNSTSIKEFWGRWHMTLARFMQKYVYIPLGGSRKGKIRTYVNVMIVFLVSGLWHGANWTYVIWGVMHGIANCFDRLPINIHKKMSAFGNWLITFVYFCSSIVFFRAPSVSAALFAFKRLFMGGMYLSQGLLYSFTGVEFVILEHTVFKSNPQLLDALFVLLVAFFLTFIPSKFRGKYCGRYFMLTVSAVLTVWSVISLSSGGAFIYFNF